MKYLFLILFLFSTLPAHADVTDGLVGWWKLDDGSGTTAVDSSGQGNTGTLTNGPTWVSGKRNQAVSFDGSNDYLHILHSASLNIGGVTSSYSISLWLNSTSSSRVDAVNKYDVTAPNGTSPLPFLIDMNSITVGKVRFYYRGTGGAPDSNTILSDLATYNDGKWHHFVAIIDRNATTASLTIDGVMKSQATGVATSMANTYAVNMGAIDNDGSFLYGNSSIDDVRIYNRALSQAEVNAIYLAGTPHVSVKGRGKISGMKVK